MSQHLTHVLRRVQVGPDSGHYVERLNARGEVCAMTPHPNKALRLQREAAEDFQREASGWFEAVPFLQIVRKPRVWGRGDPNTLH